MSATNLGFRIRDLHAFIADAGDGDEGLTAFFDGIAWIPMVAADRSRLAQLKVMASRLVREGIHQRIRLVRFSQREDLEEIT